MAAVDHPALPGRVISLHMGLGHLRAAYPLQDIARDGIIVYGSRKTTPAAEYRIWRKMRRIYYFSSNAGRIPIIGRYILKMMLRLQRIPAYYPRRDWSRPNAAARYLGHLTRSRRLCQTLVDRLSDPPLPTVHTFYATAIAAGMNGRKQGPQYLLICDSDFNRVWVPQDPRNIGLLYLAPCSQVKRRLLVYGVPAERIYLTGFPLPKENIGSAENLEILKSDLFSRLRRLDPQDRFFALHGHSVEHWLGHRANPAQRENVFNLMLAIGGAGAQTEMVETIIRSLTPALISGDMILYLSVGINRRVFERVLRFMNKFSLMPHLGKNIFIIYDSKVFDYIKAFNAALRRTDLLWTKPSELGFYCALGIPILVAPPIGTHEELNRRWLHDLHAAVEPAGPLEYIHEWLPDMWLSGRLAEAAWDGFLKGRKLGTYKIEELVRSGKFNEGHSPLNY